MKNAKSKIFLILILSFVFGIFLANFYQINFELYFFISLFLFFVFTIILRQKILFIISSSLIIIFAGFLYFEHYLLSVIPQNLPYDKNIHVSAVIDAYPDIREDGSKYIVKVIQSQDQSLMGAHILLNLPRYPQYKYADQLSINGKLEKPQNFDAFDYEMYLARYNVFAIMRYSEFDKNTLSIEAVSYQRKNLISYIYTLRTNVYNNFKRIFTEPEAGILGAVILGLKRAIPDDFIEELRIVGLSHIVVISGFHVAVMIKIFQSITTRWSKKRTFLIGTLFLIFFIILTGATPSVIRASIMAWLFLLAPIIGRKGKITNILALTVLLMILQNPLILVYDASFQLSVLAVLGLIYIMPIFDKIFSRYGEIIGSTISATLSAQVMTLPIILTSFGRVSIVAPLTNILITPLLPIIIPYGIVISVLSFFDLRLTFILSWPLVMLLKYMIVITSLFSTFSFSSIKISAGNWFILIYFIMLTIILGIFNHYERKITQKH